MRYVVTSRAQELIESGAHASFSRPGASSKPHNEIGRRAEARLHRVQSIVLDRRAEELEKSIDIKDSKFDSGERFRAVPRSKTRASAKHRRNGQRRHSAGNVAARLKRFMQKQSNVGRARAVQRRRPSTSYGDRQRLNLTKWRYNEESGASDDEDDEDWRRRNVPSSAGPLVSVVYDDPNKATLDFFHRSQVCDYD